MSAHSVRQPRMADTPQTSPAGIGVGSGPGCGGGAGRGVAARQAESRPTISQQLLQPVAVSLSALRPGQSALVGLVEDPEKVKQFDDGTPATEQPY